MIDQRRLGSIEGNPSTEKTSEAVGLFLSDNFSSSKASARRGISQKAVAKTAEHQSRSFTLFQQRTDVVGLGAARGVCDVLARHLVGKRDGRGLLNEPLKPWQSVHASRPPHALPLRHELGYACLAAGDIGDQVWLAGCIEADDWAWMCCTGTRLLDTHAQERIAVLEPLEARPALPAQAQETDRLHGRAD